MVVFELMLLGFSGYLTPLASLWLLMYIGPPGALRDSLTDYTVPISLLLPLANPPLFL